LPEKPFVILNCTLWFAGSLIFPVVLRVLGGENADFNDKSSDHRRGRVRPPVGGAARRPWGIYCRVTSTPGAGRDSDCYPLRRGSTKDYVHDTAKRPPIVALVDEVLDDWGRIDILICAQVVCPGDTILSMDEWDFHRTLDVNLAGPFFLMQRVAQVMKDQGGGLMVVATGEHTASPIPAPPPEASGFLARPQMPAKVPGIWRGKIAPASAGRGGPAYQASQAALSTLTQAAAEEFAAYNIKVLMVEDFRLLIGD
jgi:NAD(P)-dependent dehydrogenase (short-subunit alcohol dehydrogenase family)